MLTFQGAQASRPAEEIDKRVRNDDKILVTTITKRMAEELSKYFDRVGVRNR